MPVQNDSKAQTAADKAAADRAMAVETNRQAPSEEAQTQDKPEVKEDPNAVPQSYVWLADGSVLRVNDSDLPGASGAQNAYGHWQRGNKVYTVVAVHPVEDVVEESK